MKTVLFAWELGRGLGHVMNIRRIAARLRPHGVRIAAAVNDLAAADHLQGVADETIATPPWPLATQTAASRAGASSATLNDILSAAGLADSSAVQGLLAAWDGILARTRPDLLVAEFSPLAALAARGRIPVVWIGNGFTLPPDNMMRFPLLHRLAAPVWKEPDTLDAVNAALRARAWQPLEHLPQLFSGDACLVHSFPLLDPYDTQRTAPVDGPILDKLPDPRRADARTMFVYLSGGYQPHPAVFDALHPFAAQLRIHAPRLPASQLAELHARGAHVDERAPPLHDVLPATCLVVHNGGSGVASEALVAGVPQIVLSSQVEQDLNGFSLQQAGVARLLKTHEPGCVLSREIFEAALADASLASRAVDLGGWHRRYAKDADALSRAEQTCLALLKVRP